MAVIRIGRRTAEADDLDYLQAGSQAGAAVGESEPSARLLRGELFVPVGLMIIFSVVPLILAFRARSWLTPPEFNVGA
jgi:hypothetical protein